MFKNMDNKKLGIALVIILGVVLGWWLLTQSHKATAPTRDGQTADEVPMDNSTPSIPKDSATNQLPNSDAISISTQSAGNLIIIDNFALSRPGFIVIYEANADGSAGKIVGQSKLLTMKQGQDLELNVNISSGKTYIAKLYYDNGDGKFNATTDLPVKSEETPVMASFKVL
jgi:hypothetical protein